MNIVEIPIGNLKVSELNVRKDLNEREDETTIQDLADNIAANGLLHPITVRKISEVSEHYEIIAGQRRYLACQKIKKETIMCNVVKMTDQQAEQLSITENLQRVNMTCRDKIRAYKRLYDVYGKQSEKAAKAINISLATFNKYLDLQLLSDNILTRLDASGPEKITLGLAAEIRKIDHRITNIEDLLNKIQSLNNEKRIECVKRFAHGTVYGPNDVDRVVDMFVKKKFVAVENCIKMPDRITNKQILIDPKYFDDVREFLKTKGELMYVDK